MPLGLTDSDCSMFDGQESGGVQFTSVIPGGNQTVTVAGAIGMTPTRNEIAAPGGYLAATDRIWWLPQANMGGVVPKEGDYLVDADGTTWCLQSEVKTTAKGIAGTGLMYRAVTKQAR